MITVNMNPVEDSYVNPVSIAFFGKSIGNLLQAWGRGMVYTKEMMISQSSTHNRTFANFRQMMRRITIITARLQVEVHAPTRLADLS